MSSVRVRLPPLGLNQKVTQVTPWFEPKLEGHSLSGEWLEAKQDRESWFWFWTLQSEAIHEGIKLSSEMLQIAVDQDRPLAIFPVPPLSKALRHSSKGVEQAHVQRQTSRSQL